MFQFKKSIFTRGLTRSFRRFKNNYKGEMDLTKYSLGSVKGYQLLILSGAPLSEWKRAAFIAKEFGYTIEEIVKI